MTSSDLTTRVTRRTAARRRCAGAGRPAGWAARPARLGVLAGGALALGSFRLAGRAAWRAVSRGLVADGAVVAAGRPALRRGGGGVAAAAVRQRLGAPGRAGWSATACCRCALVAAGPAPGAGGEPRVERDRASADLPAAGHPRPRDLHVDRDGHPGRGWPSWPPATWRWCRAGMQNFMEVVLEQFQQMIDDVIGPEGRRYLPLIATLGLFILVAQPLGLVPGHGRRPPRT